MHSPTDPYESCLVQASAGSGKTYQLSRRFLHLVASGADCGSILCLTFTVKAADEMRSRIITEATRLLFDRKAQKEMDVSIAHFYQAACAKGDALPKPLGAYAAARAVLSATQSLQIATMDAIFMKWVSKFPWEASSGHNLDIPSPFKMIASVDRYELNEKIWRHLFLDEAWQSHLSKVWPEISRLDPDQGVLTVQKRLEELARHNTFVWASMFEKGADAFLPLIKPEHAASEAELMQTLRPALGELIIGMTKEDAYLVAITAGDLRALQGLGLITQAGGVSQIVLKGRKRSERIRTVGFVEGQIKNYFAGKAIINLNGLGAIYFQLYQMWQSVRARTSFQEGVIDFSDLAKGSFSLFRGERGAGATWLIQKSIQHLLIDEFQDSSRLQWTIFSDIASELLSGSRKDDAKGLPSTVFLVGDKKQSIYGFREAEPSVLTEASDLLSQFDKHEIPLFQSYRSAPLILDFVNQIFNQVLGVDFGEHEPARQNDGSLRIRDISQITVLPLASPKAGKADEISDLVEVEAENVARYLQEILSGQRTLILTEEEKIRPLRAGDVCILYRSATHLSVYEKALRRYGIPLRREDSRGFFARVEIVDVLNLFSYLTSPDDTLALLALFKSPFLAWSDQDVLAFAAELAAEAHVISASSLLEQKQPATFKVLQDLISYAQKKLPHELLYYVTKIFRTEENYGKAYGAEEGVLAQKNLLRLVELCVNLEDEGKVALSQVYAHLKKMAEADELSSAQTVSDLVTLMTIHKAKGLEFPMVILVDTARAWFEIDRYWLKRKGHSLGVSYVGTKQQQPKECLTFDNLIAEQDIELYQESLRLLYVALTRASHYLLISGHGKTGAGFYQALRQAASSLCGAEEIAWGGGVETLVTVNGREFALSLENIGETKVTASDNQGWSWEKNLASDLPANCEIISPHKQLGKPMQVAALSHRNIHDPKLALALGNFIHHALHMIVSKETKWEMVWAKMVQTARFEFALGKDEHWWQALQQTTWQKIEATSKHPLWQKWVLESRVLLAEQSILHFSGNRLVRGQMDLYLEMDNEIIIVDYKSHQLPPDITDVDLSILAQESGIGAQLASYAQAVRQIHPTTKINLVAWFTDIARPIFLSHSNN